MVRVRLYSFYNLLSFNLVDNKFNSLLIKILYILISFIAILKKLLIIYL